MVQPGYTADNAKADIKILLERLEFYVDNLNKKEVQKQIDAIIDQINSVQLL